MNRNQNRGNTNMEAGSENHFKNHRNQKNYEQNRNNLNNKNNRNNNNANRRVEFGMENNIDNCSYESRNNRNS